MTIRHHLSDPLLMAYSAGQLPEAFSLVVATHAKWIYEFGAQATGRLVDLVESGREPSRVGAVQDIRADRAAGIASIATAFGAKNTVRFAFASYLLAAIVLVGLGWPGNLTAIAAVPYLAIISPYLNVSDAECEKTNRGWRRFIWLNFFAGAVVSLVLITYLRAS